MAEERIKTHLLMGFIKEKLVVTSKNVDKSHSLYDSLFVWISRDYDKVDIEGLKKEKLMALWASVEDDTLQVVVGPGTVNKVAQRNGGRSSRCQIGRTISIMAPHTTDASARQIWKKDLVEEKASSNESTQQKAKQK